MISTRSVGLLIDTVVCLTLAKWETVSGRFGGYIRPASGVVPQAERSNRNQRSNCNQRGVQRVPRQPDLRKVDRLLGLQYASLEETPPKEQVLAAAVSDSNAPQQSPRRRPRAGRAARSGRALSPF